MSAESRDSAIKLFGKTIPLADVPMGVRFDVDGDVGDDDDDADDDEKGGGGEFDVVGKVREEEGRDKEKDRDEGFEDDYYVVYGDDEARETSSGARGIGGAAKREDESRLVNSKEASSSDSTTAAGVSSSKADEEQRTSDPGQKVLKKPDKILPCPRCSSMETKFCYYNNYNVNQPRHFCKKCQRYWTAGGTMRNVPVGAGRRKSKSASLASNGRHVTVPEGVQIPNGFNHSPPLKTNGTILTFGPTDSRLCESMTSVLSIGEKSLMNRSQNGFHKPEEWIIPVPCRNGENGADIANSAQAGGLRPDCRRDNDVSKDCGLQNSMEIPPQVPCFPGTPWPYPVLPPALVPQVIPMPFYPAPAYWSFPWIPQPLPPQANATSPTSPSLGKHSRDENMGKPENSCIEESPAEDNSEKSLWIPKTLRIDDPREAAKSSIWATLGIENDKGDPGIGAFKAFQPDSEAGRLVAERSAFLQANPAALSRSIYFHEKA